jgi:hypothetical protein
MPTGRPDDSLTPAEWAWCAGLFEGEGCILFAKRAAVTVSVVSSDRDVLERLDALWPSPGGVQPMAPGGLGRKPMWKWLVCSRSRRKCRQCDRDTDRRRRAA